MPRGGCISKFQGRATAACPQGVSQSSHLLRTLLPTPSSSGEADIIARDLKVYLTQPLISAIVASAKVSHKWQTWSPIIIFKIFLGSLGSASVTCARWSLFCQCS